MELFYWLVAPLKGELFMKTSYIISGLQNPSTVIEVAGSVFFDRNHHAKYFEIEEVKIEDGRLCIYYQPKDLPERLSRPKHHYLKLEPSLDVVKLVIKEYEPKENTQTHVTYYLVESLQTPAQGDYFRFRTYEADLDWPFSDNITCNVSGEFLVDHGFSCTVEYDDDKHGTVTVYHRKK